MEMQVENYAAEKRTNSSDYEDTELQMRNGAEKKSPKKLKVENIHYSEEVDKKGKVGLRTNDEARGASCRSNYSLVQSRVNYWHAAQSSEGNERALSATRTIEKITFKILEETLHNVSYNPHVCRLYCQQLSSRIMEAIKSLGVKRYKYVAVVSLGSLKERPGMHFGSRCLWDEDKDSFTTVKYQNDTLFAVALLYGLHMD